MDDAPPSSVEPAPSPRYPWYHWRRVGFNFLTISVVAHLFFGLGATYLIVQNINAKRRQTFMAPPGAGPKAPQRALEHRVQMEKKQQTMSAPAAVKRVTTTSNVRVSLPEMPAMPAMSAQVVPVAMAGTGLLGTGLSMGGGGAGGGGGGGGMSLFGFHGKAGSGLEGTFYDYKMDQGFQPLKTISNPEFGKMVKAMLPLNGAWHPEQPYRHYVSPAKLHSRYFVYPAIEDNQAGAAFQSPRSGPGHWLAVYRGAFSSPTSGSFRFVGFGDNVMIVQLGAHTVLDASDHGYTGQPREGLGSIKFPKKAGTPLFGGEWFSLSAGEPKDIAIAVGDEGGIFCSGLFIQPRNVQYAAGGNGVPKLPVFMLGAATDADRKLLGKELPLQCLQGPYFSAVAPHAEDNGLFSH